VLEIGKTWAISDVAHSLDFKLNMTMATNFYMITSMKTLILLNRGNQTIFLNFKH